MQAKELKSYLLDKTSRIYDLLEHFGFHDVWQNSVDELRCAVPDGTNRTSVSVKLVPELFATSFDDKINYRGDIFGLLEAVSGKSFSVVMRDIHDLFKLPYTKGGKSLDLLKGIRKFKKGSARRERENKKFDRSILDRFIDKPHASLIEECISPAVIKQYDIRYDVESDRVIFPFFDWIETDKVVGLQGRTTMSSELAKELNIPKYFNLIRGFAKNQTLYGWHIAKDYVNDRKMLILFEGEKSTLKLATIEFGKPYAVSVGGHEISPEQISFILKNTDSDVEIVIAFDSDIEEEFVREYCSRFSKFRKVSYIFDRHGVTGKKDSPIDCGYKKFKHLLKFRTVYQEETK